MERVEEVDQGVVITYQRILPVLVVLGLMCSAVSILVLRRPSLRNTVGNKYFLALSWCDLLLCASYITIAVTASGCDLNSYASAWFFAYFGWAIINAFHALGTYIILFMSLDRFVAVWFPLRFEPLTRPPFHITNRLVVSAVLALGLHMIFIVDGEVLCKELPTLANNYSRMTLPLDNCTDNTYYISIDGYLRNYNKPWHTAYRNFYTPMVRWLPFLLVIGLNLSLVVGVLAGRVKLPGAKVQQVRDEAAQAERGMTRQHKKMNQQERVLVATVIAMTVSFVVMTMPITIFLAMAFFVKPNGNFCEKLSPEFTLMHVGNMAYILEHVLHGVYLFFINPSFRRELLCLLGAVNRKTQSKDITLPTSGRLHSSNLQSSDGACKDSLATVQSSRLSCSENIEEKALKDSKSKSLPKETWGDKPEKFTPLSSDTTDEFQQG